MRAVVSAIIVLTGALLCAAAALADEPLRIAVSIDPQVWLVERIAGERATVTVAVPAGSSPSVYDPTPRRFAELADADLYLATGVPMENQLLPRLRASLPDLEIVDTAAGLDLRELEHHDHGHDHGHEHDHGDLDPHVWLDPALFQVQADLIAATLARLDPDGADAYEAGRAAVAAELQALAAELATILAPIRGQELFVFHPAFGYLADAHGLRQTAIEQGGLDPSPRRVAEVLERARAQGARAVFVQPQFSMGSARAVARAVGVELVVLDPLARDYPANLRAMARAIAQAF